MPKDYVDIKKAKREETTTHNLGAIKSNFTSKFSKSENRILDELCEDTTSLISKNISTNPVDYIPISCLNTFYKLVTACIAELISRHRNIIMGEDQNGITWLQGTTGYRQYSYE